MNTLRPSSHTMHTYSPPRQQKMWYGVAQWSKIGMHFVMLGSPIQSRPIDMSTDQQGSFRSGRVKLEASISGLCLQLFAMPDALC